VHGHVGAACRRFRRGRVSLRSRGTARYTLVCGCPHSATDAQAPAGNQCEWQLPGVGGPRSRGVATSVLIITLAVLLMTVANSAQRECICGSLSRRRISGQCVPTRCAGQQQFCTTLATTAAGSDSVLNEANDLQMCNAAGRGPGSTAVQQRCTGHVCVPAAVEPSV
jgi:hypothetical protein